MYNKIILLFSLCSFGVVAYPYLYETKKFKVGIEYDHSLPMYGGSDRYRHRNNYEPFYVTITANAKKGYVISYIEVSATVDEGGEVDFHVVRGSTGSRTMVFQLVSNHSDFLSYNYLTYGIREEQFHKIENVITVPMTNNETQLQYKGLFIIIPLILSYFIIL